MSKPYEALVFDFDGVLADSDAAHTTARITAFEAFDIRVDADTHAEAHLHGAHTAEIIGWTLKAAGYIADSADVTQDPLVKKIVATKNSNYYDLTWQGLAPIEGALDFLAAAVSLYRPGHLAIATTATRQNEVTPFLIKHGLEMAFLGNIVAREDTGDLLKPHPLAYREAVRRLHVSPSRAAAIEDSAGGLISARAAGLDGYGITTTHPASALEPLATKVVASFAELSPLLLTDSRQRTS